MPIQPDREEFTTIFTSLAPQPSRAEARPTYPATHYWILPFKTIDYDHYQLPQLLCNSAASEDVGKICPNVDVFVMPLPTSDVYKVNL